MIPEWEQKEAQLLLKLKCFLKSEMIRYPGELSSSAIYGAMSSGSREIYIRNLSWWLMEHSGRDRTILPSRVKYVLEQFYSDHLEEFAEIRLLAYAERPQFGPNQNVAIGAGALAAVGESQNVAIGAGALRGRRPRGSPAK